MPARARQPGAQPNANGDKPADVSLNLDKLEREGGPPQPFVVVHGGRRFVFADLDDEDWQIVVDVDENDPVEALRMLLGRQYDDFAAIKLPVWKLRQLLDAWREYTTGLDVGNASASPTSSRGTARRSNVTSSTGDTT